MIKRADHDFQDKSARWTYTRVQEGYSTNNYLFRFLPRSERTFLILGLGTAPGSPTGAGSLTFDFFMGGGTACASETVCWRSKLRVPEEEDDEAVLWTIAGLGPTWVEIAAGSSPLSEPVSLTTTCSTVLVSWDNEGSEWIIEEIQRTNKRLIHDNDCHPEIWTTAISKVKMKRTKMNLTFRVTSFFPRAVIPVKSTRYVLLTCTMVSSFEWYLNIWPGIHLAWFRIPLSCKTEANAVTPPVRSPWDFTSLPSFLRASRTGGKVTWSRRIRGQKPIRCDETTSLQRSSWIKQNLVIFWLWQTQEMEL